MFLLLLVAKSHPSKDKGSKGMNISPVSTSCLYPNGVTVFDDVTPGNVVADKINLSLVAPYLWVYLRTTGPPRYGLP